MANVAKNAILRAKIEGVLTDIMVKTTVGQVYVNDSTTLAAHLATLASTADVQALQQAIDALGALSKKDKVSYADLETALASLIDGKAEASALTEEIARAKAAEEAAAAAASAAQAAADKAQGDVDALAGLVGELPDGTTASSIVAFVEEKTTGIASESVVSALTDRVAANEGNISGLTERMGAAEGAAEALAERVTAAEGAVEELAPIAKTGSWNDMVDKPFGEEGEGGVVVYDGNPEGRDTFDLGVVTYVKISDVAPNSSELIGGIVKAGEVEREILASDIDTDGLTDCYYVDPYGLISFFVFQSTEVSIDGETKSVPSVGIYIKDQYANDSISLTYGSSSIKTLDSKFIGPDIARVADQSALAERVSSVEGLVGTENVAEKISAAVAAEKSRAEGIEAGLRTDVNAIAADYLKAADKTELEGKITANANAIELLTNGVSAEEVDGVNDLIQYVKEHGTEVTGIKADIKANADALAALAPVAQTGSWNDLADRPFYEEGDGYRFEWNGSYSSTTDFSGTRMCKVSDVTPTADELIGAKVERSELVNADTGEYTVVETHILDSSNIVDTPNYGFCTILSGEEEDGEMNTQTWAIILYEGNVAGLEPGFYMSAKSNDTGSDVNGDYYYRIPSSITIGEYTLKKLDEKFLPDSIDNRFTGIETNLETVSQLAGQNSHTLSHLGALANKDVVSESDLDSALAEKVNAAAEGNHSHSNKDVLDGITAEKVTAWDASEQNAKDYAKDYADGLNTAMNTRVEALEAIDHEHANADVLDGITSAKVTAWDGAVAKQHEHANSDVLAGISAEKVAAWDASEQNAKTYAKDYTDGLNTAMDTRVQALEAIDHSHANATVLDGITAEKVSAWDAAEQNAKTYADGLDDAMDTRMKVVEALKHNHENKTVLDGITSNMVSAWNGKAKVYAAGETVDLPEGEIFIQLI